MWGKRVVNKESTFFSGKSIFETLKNSLFGKIKQVINNLVENDEAKLEQYKLPKVIVIGNESTGKSSLLENITKCQLFPRDNKLCTKAPIHLVLNNGVPKYVVKYCNPEANIDTVIELADKKDIYTEVNKIMDSILPDTISEHEIVIEMTDVDLPRFDFYDLPGIRSYPPKTAEITTNICKKYLNDKNSIVLCVVPANVTRLTSCQSIALITEMNMGANCILALTMADRLQEANIEDLLIKRILQTSDEMVNLNFAGCISVVNRLHTDQYNLEENDDVECQWFNDNIIQYIPTEYAEHKLNIENNITVSNLLRKMDDLYNKFIHTDWKPRVIEKITADTILVQKEIDSLGPEFISTVELSDLLKEFIITKMLPKFVSDAVKIADKKYTSTAQTNQYYSAMNRIKDLAEELKNYITQMITMTNFVNQNFFVANKKLVLNRFNDAQTEFKNKLFYANDQLVQCELPNIIRAVENYLNFLYMEGIEFTPELIEIKFNEMVTLLITRPLLSSYPLIDTNKTGTFKESEQHGVVRNNLTKRLQMLTNYRDCINSI